MITSDEDDLQQIEIHVLQDVIETIDTALRSAEQRGLRLTAPRSHIYATVLYAVVDSARKRCFRATLDGADILDSILDGVESLDADGDFVNPVESAVSTHTAPVQ
ncbi:hypothetical protein HLB23_23915 [Nocardia uniformis]|uniref:Uncharacterized protein n=1 Tax=Nocardia uniformis TaxID=53432 RepID=A0A849CAA1_9NOCA|nr:hypothetical protein [Nocardia uniformis]NNH72867.1 hypothetical protein [Nocardia uniformis]